jgi:hypothetical protein
MGCFEDLQTCLCDAGNATLLLFIQNNTTGTAGAGATEAVQDPIDDSIRTGPAPGDSSTWAEYDVAKCNWANNIVQGWIDDMAEMGQMTALISGAAGVFTAAMILAFATPIPLDDLVVLGLLLVASALAIVINAIDGLERAVAGNREAFLCDIYQSDTVQLAQDAVRLEMDDLIDADPAVSSPALAKNIWTYFFTNDAINPAFSGNFLGANEAMADCSCGAEVIEVLDNFVDVVGTRLPAHTPDTAPVGSSWTEHLGSAWEIIAGDEASPDGVPGARVSIDSEVSDCSLEAFCTWPTGGSAAEDVGITFRASGTNDFWGWSYRNAGVQKLRLIKYTNNVGALIQNFDIDLPVNATLRVDLLGPSILCYANDILRISENDGYQQTGTVHGMRANNAGGAEFDTFKVTT